ncbi:hypothetical protein [Streptomyces sp. GC420]|uniref:hypothetical protein n=1 Tax=Streptomyces sp. GC420 TaxID=2697568 RepID=UPI001414EABB|nr:hypothetical protein [Streptomyces sp. GC420]NBM19751.1 hypothetical protein [Streptomyces sp. GC420]
MRQNEGGRAERAPGGRSGRLLRRFGRRAGDPASTGTTGNPAPGDGPAPPHTVTDEFPHRFLLRSSAVPDSPVRELVRELSADPRQPVVVVDVPQSAAGNLGEELGSLLARLREERPLAIRLVLSGSAAPAGEHGPLAQRLADAWEVPVEAPDAPAVITPGGLLHVPEPATPGGGWWRFAPGAAPEALGVRLPAPRWQRALTRVLLGPMGQSVVRAVPAGLALYPADTAAPRPDEPAYAVAVHPERLSVLIGAPRAKPVAAEDLATLLACLPAESRCSVRLVPADGRDGVNLAEEVCDLLGSEIEVSLGLPVAADRAVGGENGRESVRLISPEGEFTWCPPLTAVVCHPTGDDGARPAPRPAAWTLPGTAGAPEAEPASLRLPSGAWVVAVRSGLWLGTSPRPPAEVRDRAADSRALRVEIAPDCLAGKAVREGCLNDLATLLAGLAHSHAELAVFGDARPELVAELRRFAVHAGLTLAAPRQEGGPARSGSAPEPRETGAPPERDTGAQGTTAAPRPGTLATESGTATGAATGAAADPAAGADTAAMPEPSPSKSEAARRASHAVVEEAPATGTDMTGTSEGAPLPCESRASAVGAGGALGAGLGPAGSAPGAAPSLSPAGSGGSAPDLREGSGTGITGSSERTERAEGGERSPGARPAEPVPSGAPSPPLPPAATGGTSTAPATSQPPTGTATPPPAPVNGAGRPRRPPPRARPGPRPPRPPPDMAARPNASAASRIAGRSGSWPPRSGRSTADP